MFLKLWLKKLNQITILKKIFRIYRYRFLVPADVENDVKVKTTVVDKTGSIDSVVGDSISLRPFMTARFQLASGKNRK